MTDDNTMHVIQVTNIAPQATRDQMKTLFENFGRIQELRLYPTLRSVSCLAQSRICYVKYSTSSGVKMAQHLTNTVFIDRALIIIPVADILDEDTALEKLKNGTLVPGLEKRDSKLPPEVFSVKEDAGKQQQVINTYDPKLVGLKLPEYPALPSVYDDQRVEQTRRTIIVCDVKEEWLLEDLIKCFQSAGEVKFAAWAEKKNKKYGVIEFREQASVIKALLMQGQEFKGGHLNVFHSTNSITKPEVKSNQAAQAEIEAAMTTVKEAQMMISTAINPFIGMLSKNRRTSRSRSPRSTLKRGRSRSMKRRSESPSGSKRSKTHQSPSPPRSMQPRSYPPKTLANRSRSAKRRSATDPRRVRYRRSRTPSKRNRLPYPSEMPPSRSTSKHGSVKSPPEAKPRSGHSKESPLATSKSSSSQHKSISKDTETKTSGSRDDSKPRKSESSKKSDKNILTPVNNNK